LYINDIVNYDETYGALAGIAILMVYLYGVSFLLLLGAEMNQVIELNHPEGKNEGEKVPEGEKVGDVG
ncbi:MAG: YhjD/YihY/BrkB family envelope integrity protein, partial [Dehalococcoidia bacterium]